MEYAAYIYNAIIGDIEFMPEQGGIISIADEPYSLLKDGTLFKKPYVIGADTAGTGEDYFTAKVLDNTCGKCVATLRAKHMDEDLFAEQLYCLGKYYNDVLIGIEINYSRHPVNVLRELNYPTLYKETDTQGQDGRIGFLTTAVTRPIIISNLVAIMREGLELETDKETLKELSTFVRHPSGKCAAANGSHDDLVMASAIAHHISKNFPHEIQITDTGSDILAKYIDCDPCQSFQFMEW